MLSGMLLSSVIIPNRSSAQDTMHFRNGDVLIGSVIEITSDIVKYKKSQNLDGPDYSDFKNDISSIHFKNGIVENFEYQMPVQSVVLNMEVKKEDYFVEPKKHPSVKKFGKTKFLYDGALIGNHDFHSVMLGVDDKRITNHITLAKKQERGQYIGFAFFPCAIAGIAIAGMNSAEAPALGAFMGVLGVACFATSITLKVKRNQNEAAALKLYQQHFN